MILNVDALKDQLIDKLWLPIVRESGFKFYPRLRKNKRMKMLTLTNDRNFNEIMNFETDKLTQRANTLAWTRDTLRRIRLETESIGLVLGGSLYEQAILDVTSPITNHFPRDIFNLDFSSQDPDLGNGRVEKEIEGLSKTIFLQNQKGGNNFVLIYTTIIDANIVNKNSVVKIVNGVLSINGSSLNTSDFPQDISDANVKKSFIEWLLPQMCQVSGYTNLNSNSLLVDIPGHNEKLFSIGGIFRK